MRVSAAEFPRLPENREAPGPPVEDVVGAVLGEAPSIGTGLVAEGRELFGHELAVSVEVAGQDSAR